MMDDDREREKARIAVFEWGERLIGREFTEEESSELYDLLEEFGDLQFQFGSDVARDW